MHRLMNSAMMPVPKSSDKAGNLRSYIGYAQTVEFIGRFTGINFPVCVDQIDDLKDGDTLLCIRLRYRTRTKGAPVDESDFAFFLAEYSAT